MSESKPCSKCDGIKYIRVYEKNTVNVVKCPACYGIGVQQVGFEEGQEHPNQGVNCPTGSSVGFSVPK